MKFSRPDADVYVPEGGDPAKVLARTTHLCVIAHQDDIEINAYPAVAVPPREHLERVRNDWKNYGF